MLNKTMVCALRKAIPLLLPIILLLAACEKSKDSGNTASEQQSSRAGLSAREMDDNMFFFGFAVADELYFKNSGYKFEMPNPIDIQITNPKTGKSLTLAINDLKDTRGKRTAAEMADEIYSRMQRELGDPPAPAVNPHPLMEPMMLGHAAGQKKRYPEKWRQEVAFDYREALAEADQAWKKGNKEQAIDILKEQVSYLRSELGQLDPLFLESMSLYTRYSGKTLYFQDNKYGTTIWDLTPEEAAQKGLTAKPGAVPIAAPVHASPSAPSQQQSLAEADNEIKNAAQKWQANDYAGAITHAEKALKIRTDILGANHPKTLEVQKMLTAARQAQQKK